jgi:hypothetical protein
VSYTAPRDIGGHILSTISGPYCLALSTTSPSAAAAYPTADLAIYTPVLVMVRVVVLKLFVAVASASGNLDVGLYDAAGIRLVSSGTTAAAVPFTPDVTDTTIGPGLYYLAVVADNTTVTITRDSDAAPVCAATGLLTEQLGAGGTLPATATWVVPQTLAYYPVVAASLGTVL